MRLLKWPSTGTCAGKWVWLFLILQVWLTAPVFAHGFGQRFDLPMPLWLYLTGAGLTVAFSFLILALRRPVTVTGVARFNLSRTPLRHVIDATWLRLVLRLLAIALYVLVILAGLIGVQNPVKNIAPAMIWAIWWVGIAYISALVGNVWGLLNPLDSLFCYAEQLYFLLLGRQGRRNTLVYPEAAGIWPAVVLFFLFIWMELNWEGSEQPTSLACAILLYSALTWLGMAVYGREVWLQRGEIFSILFGLLARFSPLQIEGGNWYLRPYAVGLLNEKPIATSGIVLVILMLASVSFDGVMETQPWLDLLLYTSQIFPQTMAMPFAMLLFKTAALLVIPSLFLLIFLGCCRLISAAGSAGEEDGGAVFSTMRIAGMFVLTLVPISIAYHFAHYLSFLAMAGQYLIPLASDPLDLGWNLFGTKLYFIRIGIVDAKMVWYVSLLSIILGHIAAVYLAHVTAMRLYSTRQAAIRSQYPMLLLMVCYTMISLWIMAQPIVSM